MSNAFSLFVSLARRLEKFHGDMRTSVDAKDKKLREVGYAKYLEGMK